jgi:predicted nucleic acid-binding protein
MAIVLATIDRDSLPAKVAVSTLTFAELVVGPHGATHDLARARREHQLRYVRVNVEPLDFDLRCARAYGPVYGAVVRKGRKPRGARAIDVMIAATALAHDLPLYTRNAKDLRGLESLIEIVDIGDPSAT